MHGMTIELARAVFADRGSTGPVTALAQGMSSCAWIGHIRGDEWVVRTPTPDDIRPDPDYGRERRLNEALRAVGVPATRIETVAIDGVECSLAPRISGRPVRPGGWNDEFVRDVAAALAAAHSITGADHDLPDALERFHLARIWPLDESSLDDHPVVSRLPDATDWIRSLEDPIRSAAAAPSGIVHTDLHWDHLLQDDRGRLAGLLDFGDAFRGPPGWDLACLRYYHGEEVGRRVADAHPGGDDVWAQSHILGIAFALYKLDKTPDRPAVVRRVTDLFGACR